VFLLGGYSDTQTNKSRCEAFFVRDCSFLYLFCWERPKRRFFWTDTQINTKKWPDPFVLIVLFGFFVQIIPPRGMSICHMYTNTICPGFFLWREGPSSSEDPLPSRRHNSSASLASSVSLLPSPLVKFFYRQRSCFPALSPMTSPLPPDFLALPKKLSLKLACTIVFLYSGT